MTEAFNKIKTEMGGTLGIDGATDNLAKSKSNVILHTPFPIFIEYIKGDLDRETTPNVVSKVEDSIRRLNEKVGSQCVNSFVSDSCNGMRDVRKKLIEKKLFAGSTDARLIFLIILPRISVNGYTKISSSNHCTLQRPLRTRGWWGKFLRLCARKSTTKCIQSLCTARPDGRLWIWCTLDSSCLAAASASFLMPCCMNGNDWASTPHTICPTNLSKPSRMRHIGIASRRLTKSTIIFANAFAIWSRTMPLCPRRMRVHWVFVCTSTTMRTWAPTTNLIWTTV